MSSVTRQAQAGWRGSHRRPQPASGTGLWLHTASRVPESEAPQQPGRWRRGFAGRLIGGATLISVSRVLQQGVGFLLLPLYTRILTPEDYGRIEVLMVSVLFSLMVLGQGLPPSLLRQLTYVHRENEERRRVVAGSALAYLVLSSVVFVAFAALISSDMAGLFFGDSEYSYVVLIGALLVGLQGVTALGSAVLLARQRVLVVVVVGFIQFGTKLFLNIYLVMFLKLGFVGIIWGHLAGDIVGALAFCWAMRRHIEWQWRRLDVVELRALLRYGLPLIASSLSLQVLFLSDRYVIRYLRPSAELGLYAVAAKFATAFFFILVEPFDRMWEVSSLEVLGRPNGRQHIARVANAFLVAGTSACLLAIVVAEPLVGLAAAPAFGAAHAAVGLLMAGALLCGLGEVFRVGLRAAGASGTMAAIAAGAAVFNVVVTIKLVPRSRIHGGRHRDRPGLPALCQRQPRGEPGTTSHSLRRPPHDSGGGRPAGRLSGAAGPVTP